MLHNIVEGLTNSIDHLLVCEVYGIPGEGTVDHLKEEFLEACKIAVAKGARVDARDQVIFHYTDCIIY
jgi:hypothetical protein